ncbi:hypothetical protein Gpo141_00000762 [Globisporangium polare]
MRTSAFGLLALAAVATAVLEQLPTAVDASATTTCPLYIQSRVASTLSNPITEVVKSSKKSTSGSSDSSSDGDATVGSSDSSGGNSKTKDTGSSKDSTGSAGTSDDTAGVASTPKPSSSSSTSTSSPSPTPTTATPKTSTPVTTTTPTTTAPTSGSTAGTSGAGTTGTTTPTPTSRSLLSVTVNAGSSTGASVSTTTTPTPTTTPATAGIATTPTTTSPTTSTTTTPVPTSKSTDTPSSNSTVDSVVSSNSSSGSNSTSITSADTFTCDETFYNQWTTLGITCGSASIDVSAAVAASSCVIYSGSVGSITGSTCVSICSFPTCTSGAWVYGSDNGLASSVYAKYELDQFMTSAMKSRLTTRSSASSTFLTNSTMTSTKQCAYSSESSFSSCSCSALLVNETAATDAEKKQERATDQANGVITEDSTSLVGNVLGPTSKSIAGVTVAISTIAAVASSVVSGAGAATSAVAAAGANVAVVTVEICQFGVFINQLNLSGKSAALSLFGKQMAPAAFTFLPFGKLNSEDDSTTRRLMGVGRRLSSDSTAPDSGIAKYSRILGIKEDMLFLVTLAGVIVVMAGILFLFGVAYAASGLFMSREDFMVKFFDKMIGLELLILILSQYTLGVTGTYQIYHSVEQNDPTDPKCILAALSLLFLAFGIIFYGYIIVRKHEEEIKDVGTVAHMKKPVNMRYGPLYDEYKFKNRFFFAPKMMLALVTGCATGYVGAESTYQVSVVLGAHVLFFFYLEIKSPHHSRFVQTTTSFVTIMKIAVLVLTFFLISAAAADGFPSELQNGISLAIVGLNLFVLFLLMIRSIYTFWKKYQLQRDAKFDEEDEQTAQDYFKDETPQQKEQMPIAALNQQQSKHNLQPQQVQPKSPYITNQNDYNIDDDRTGGEEIRLRSGTHMQENAGSYEVRSYDENRRTAANHYIADERAGYGQRRNDVVEL